MGKKSRVGVPLKNQYSPMKKLSALAQIGEILHFLKI
jgi:hypothetical protein